MPSETDLLNDALSQIGATPINAIDDGSVNANHCQRTYPALRDGLLRAAHWNFASKRVQLAQDAEVPAFEFAYSYTLPADCLKVREYYGGSPSTGDGTDLALLEARQLAKWRVEGRKLLTNAGEVMIVYTARITNPDEFDPIFYQLLSTWMASKLANAIAKDPGMAKGLLAQAVEILLPLAAAVDGQEQSVEAMQVIELIQGR